MSEEAPKCDKCGVECTTGMMAAYCSKGRDCEFWPHSNGEVALAGAELLMYRFWMDNTLEQIGLQIEDRNRLERELAEARHVISDVTAERDRAMDANLLRVARYLPPPASGDVVAADSMPPPSYAEVTAYAVSLRKFIEALPCPNPRCSDGSIISTGPDPQNDACEWCYMRHMLLNEAQSGHEIGHPSPGGDNGSITPTGDMALAQRVAKAAEDFVGALGDNGMLRLISEKEPPAFECFRELDAALSGWRYRDVINPVHAVGHDRFAKVGEVFKKISENTKDQTATFERCLSQGSKQEPTT